MEDEITRLAEERGLGEHVLTEAFLDGGYACLTAFVPLLLAGYGIPGTILADSWTGRGISIGLVVLAPVAGYLLWRLYDRRWHRAPKLYCFEHGLVFTGQDQPRAYSWREVTVVRRTRTATIGQAPSRKTFAYMDIIVTATGEKLCGLGEANNLLKVIELAERA